MIRKVVLPVLAVLGALFAAWTVFQGSRPPVVAQPVTDPAQGGFAEFVAGAGIIEASSENISIGTAVPGVVDEVHVVVGSKVKVGDKLFTLDARQLTAELKTRDADLVVAQAQVKRLEAQKGVLDARLKEAQLARDDAALQLKRLLDATESSRSKDEVSRRTFARDTAQQRVDQAQADMALWEQDMLVARAQAQRSEAGKASIQTELDRLVVKAPVAGELLQVKIRPGEFAQAGALSTPLMLLGSVERLFIRVDIDENDAWRIRPGARAEAMARGNKQFKVNPKFERIEPYIVPKRSLTGDSNERVDTRVLQVLYSFERADLPLYVGQQMDVFIETTGTRAASGK